MRTCALYEPHRLVLAQPPMQARELCWLDSVEPSGYPLCMEGGDVHLYRIALTAGLSALSCGYVGLSATLHRTRTCLHHARACAVRVAARLRGVGKHERQTWRQACDIAAFWFR